MAGGFAVANLFFICFSGIVTATSVILGQELGAGNIDGARTQKNWILSGSVLFGILFMFIGFLSMMIVPFVFVNLTEAAQKNAKGIIFVAAVYLPLWAYLNAQYAISRAGGDTKMGAVCDFVANIIYIGSMIPLVLFTAFTPVVIYAIVKISDFVKAAIAYFWLKKEKWLVNLTEYNK